MPSNKTRVTAYLDDSEAVLFKQLRVRKGFKSDSALLLAAFHCYREQQEAVPTSENDLNLALQQRFDALQEQFQVVHWELKLLISQQAQQRADQQNEPIENTLKGWIQQLLKTNRDLDVNIRNALHLAQGKVSRNKGQ